MSSNIIITDTIPSTSLVYSIHPGLYGATISRNGESIYLRMELITQENAKAWTNYANATYRMANGRTGGVLAAFMRTAGTDKHPAFEDAPASFGFTREEYTAFTTKVAERKKIDDKIVTLIRANDGGSAHIFTGYQQGQIHYIVYATTNPQFSICSVADFKSTLADYIHAYQDILITVGSHFNPEERSFHNRGIFRNPFWVMEGKYAGLSMLLHGMTGAVAQQFHPEMTTMRVRPLGSMQVVIKKHLQRGEGFVNIKNEKVDILDLETSVDDAEGEINEIHISALTRILGNVTN